MRSAIKIVLVIVSMVFVFSSNAYCADVTANVTVGTTVDMSVDSPTYNFGNLTSSDFDLGYKTVSTASVLTLKSNVNWQVTVKTTSVNMGVVGGYTKPISDFLWKTGGGAFTAITSIEVQVTTGAPTASSTVNMDYKLLTGWVLDKPGNYSITITYKLLSN